MLNANEMFHMGLIAIVETSTSRDDARVRAARLLPEIDTLCSGIAGSFLRHNLAVCAIWLHG